MQGQLEHQQMPKKEEEGKMWHMGKGSKKLQRNLWKMLSPQEWDKFRWDFKSTYILFLNSTILSLIFAIWKKKYCVENKPIITMWNVKTYL